MTNDDLIAITKIELVLNLIENELIHLDLTKNAYMSIVKSSNLLFKARKIIGEKCD